MKRWFAILFYLLLSVHLLINHCFWSRHGCHISITTFMPKTLDMFLCKSLFSTKKSKKQYNTFPLFPFRGKNNTILFQVPTTTLLSIQIA